MRRWPGMAAEIYRFALHLTRNRTDADDLYQETALKAYRAWDRLPCDANHRAWLYRIASNTFLSDKRKTSRLRSLDAQETVESIPAASRDDDGRLDAGNLLREVEVFIEAPPAETTYCPGATEVSGYWLPGDRGHTRLLRRGRAPQRARGTAKATRPVRRPDLMADPHRRRMNSMDETDRTWIATDD